jgi:type I restriction enzyme R subunit
LPIPRREGLHALWTPLNGYTDGKELDEQIYRKFANTGAVTEKQAHASSSAHLRRLLTEDHRYVFTLIHKFGTPKGKKHPVLSERSDIIVLTDEAHRTQYDTLALNMRTALPNAAFLAFTGTPLLAGEEKTREVFGDYVSVYNFKQSVDDKATVPLYYENRIPELQLRNDKLTEDIARLVEATELDEDQEAKLEREFAREYHLITRDDRLDALAADLVKHFIGRGFQGKAMVVCIDKATAVRMHDKVRREWAKHLDRLRAEAATAPEERARQLQGRVAYMEETDMAVVVSQSQGEIRECARKGANIRPHRQRMLKEDLDTKFKDADDPFRIVFVCAMWMTGFDVPCCSTIYLDKPMRNHTLMQTIARANRVFGDKQNGLIVDYVGVFRNLQKALALYGSASGGGVDEDDTPVADKSELVEALKRAIEQANEFCAGLGIDLAGIQVATGFDRVARLDGAVEAILIGEDTKKRFLSLAGDVGKLYKAVLPDPVANQVAPRCALLDMLVRKLRSLTSPPDISGVMRAVDGILDDSIAAEGYVIRTPSPAYGLDHTVDLSRIDFEAVRRQLGSSRRRTEAEKLRGMIDRKLHEMLRVNRSRMNWTERFEKMIEEYNAGSVNVEEWLRRLIGFAQELTEEEQRAQREGLTDEELAVFDLLTDPKLELGPRQRARVKRAARELLQKLKARQFVLDWRKRQQSRAAVQVAIRDTLDDLPKCYTARLCEQKGQAVYQHVYEAYWGAGSGVYAMAH